MKTRSWDKHYASEKSELRYPDENLVRLLKKNMPFISDPARKTAVDLGCGSGRHLGLLADFGFSGALGMDTSFNALMVSKQHVSLSLVQASIGNIPLKHDSIDIAVAWGSLHYNRKHELAAMLLEIRRVLRQGGHLFATLRSFRDTYLKRGEHLGNDTWITNLRDISGSVVSFYGEDELKTEFSIFGEFEYGLIERTAMGDITTLISHWVIHARK
ncbi:MAG: hypothetical protein A2176_08185 [Spirochaetes bacterium RBG_13_51_14]|nr:MAG: hypothetical protein A2176_08185 [Spirochaetes bacterium RBG_13_51_14]